MSIDSQYIIRYLANGLTPEEKEFFELWLAESDAHKEEFASVALLWEELGKGSAPPPVLPDDAWARLEQRIASGDAPEAASTQGEPRRAGCPGPQKRGDGISVASFGRPRIAGPLHRRPALRAAAAALVVAGTALIGVLVMRTGVRHDVPAPAAVHEVTTKNGQRLTILFPDGSAAYLNAGSRLRYPDSFGDAERRIEMEGEAYFTVARDPQRPFRIITGGAVTEVLGTEFNIRYRDSLYSLTVAKGVVQTSDRNISFRLKKGDRIFYNAARSSFSRVLKANPEYSFAWRENKLAFDHATLEQAMKELELWYDVRVRFGDRAATRKTLSGVFRTESLDEILTNIGFALNVSVVRNGKRIYVR